VALWQRPSVLVARSRALGPALLGKGAARPVERLRGRGPAASSPCSDCQGVPLWRPRWDFASGLGTSNDPAGETANRLLPGRARDRRSSIDYAPAGSAGMPARSSTGSFGLAQQALSILVATNDRRLSTAPAPPPQKQHDPVSEARNVADRPARGSSGGAFGCKWAQNVANGSGGVLPTNSTTVIPFPSADRRSKFPSTEVPSHCGHAHPLTPGSVQIAARESRWRCRQCGRERAAAFRRRQKPAAWVALHDEEAESVRCGCLLMEPMKSPQLMCCTVARWEMNQCDTEQRGATVCDRPASRPI
jgi:hypothetical protein